MLWIKGDLIFHIFEENRIENNGMVIIIGSNKMDI